ncbi:hypothetical protein HNP86_001938 [Methanococcus maripaludis]|uniref:Uncharacterized protein n=1 Tax=Methanococcus maripaludis TaxID=39152 RepID=A0A7J9NVS1_METMI|nr:hypothetical protein [Methanococcus maripaludis]MBA2851779.1 hypothetical protein [Methanococcus maripaludis]
MILGIYDEMCAYVQQNKLDTATEGRIYGATVELTVNRLLSTILSHTNKKNKHAREVFPVALKNVLPDELIRELLSQMDTDNKTVVKPKLGRFTFGVTKSIIDNYYE